MGKKLIFVIFLAAIAIVLYLVLSNAFTQGEKQMEKGSAHVEKALDESIPKEDRGDISLKDRAMGAAHKKKAYDYSKKAHDRTGDYLEKHSDEIEQ